MARISLHDVDQIAEFLCQDKGLHLYSLGDLDPFFWPQTLWYGWEDRGENGERSKLAALVLVYLGQSLPTVLAFGQPTSAMMALLKSLIPLLPARFYLHLSAGLRPCLEPAYQLNSHGEHSRMVLVEPEKLQVALAQHKDLSVVRNLDHRDLDAILDLYQRSYPGNWFDARMLETGMYRGIYQDQVLVSIAGIHVYSPSWKVAALGNITTDPQVRGQGLGSLTTAVLCRDLLQSVDLIGLNVKSDNLAALACYHKLGFVETGKFEEFDLELSR
jgi:ribosomal protein S18 acetylase RimI-like enzyme